MKPQAIDIDGSESERLRQVKTLIQRMTSYKPVHRPPSQLVAQQTALVYRELEKRRNDGLKRAAVDHPETNLSTASQSTTGKSPACQGEAPLAKADGPRDWDCNSASDVSVTRIPIQRSDRIRKKAAP